MVNELKVQSLSAGMASISAVMRSVSLPGTTGVVRGYRIEAAGARGGTASTKTVTARLGTTVVGQVNYLAADTGTWADAIAHPPACA